MASSRDHHRRVDGVRVHARLVVVVQRHKRPVGHDARDAHAALIRSGDKILDSRGIEQLHIRHAQHLAQHGAGEQRRVPHDDEVALVLERHADLAQEGVGRLAHDHGGEQLAAQPRAAAGRHAGLDDGNAQVGAQRAQGVGGAEAAGARADDDDVRLGVGVQVREVAARHGAGDGALADGREGEGVPGAHHVIHGLGEALRLGGLG